MNYKLFINLGVCLFCIGNLFSQTNDWAKKAVQLMGCGFEVTAVADNDTIAWKAVEAGIAEISRIEGLISSWQTTSQTSEINRMAGKRPVVVDQELFYLILRAKKVSELTEGAFDISFASMDRLYIFDGMEHQLPEPSIVNAARDKINWKNIELNENQKSVFLKEAGMKISFGAIGKGYAANMARKVMSNMSGVQGGLVNASGDLISWGKNHEGNLWKVQIAKPDANTSVLGWLEVEKMAVVTSGDYEKFFTSAGARYGHIIDPRTGLPTQGIKSVTIVCPDAELADALATSVFVLGSSEGMKLLNKLNGIEGLIITDDDQILQSTGLQLNIY